MTWQTCGAADFNGLWIRGQSHNGRGIWVNLRSELAVTCHLLWRGTSIHFSPFATNQFQSSEQNLLQQWSVPHYSTALRPQKDIVQSSTWNGAIVQMEYRVWDVLNHDRYVQPLVRSCIIYIAVLLRMLWFKLISCQLSIYTGWLFGKSSTGSSCWPSEWALRNIAIPVSRLRVSKNEWATHPASTRCVMIYQRFRVINLGLAPTSCLSILRLLN